MEHPEHKFTDSFVCDNCGMTRKEALMFDELVKVLASQAGYSGGAGPSMDEIKEEAKRRLERGD